MLETLFGKLLSMSLVGGYAIIIVLAARLFLIKIKCERKYAYYLWFVVFLNLCLPISIQGHFSLIPRQVSQLSLEESLGLYSGAGIDGAGAPSGDGNMPNDGGDKGRGGSGTDAHNSAAGAGNGGADMSKNSDSAANMLENLDGAADMLGNLNDTADMLEGMDGSAGVGSSDIHDAQASKDYADGLPEGIGKQQNGVMADSKASLFGFIGKNDFFKTQEGQEGWGDSTVFWKKAQGFGGMVWLLGIMVIVLWNLYNGLRLKKQLERNRRTLEAGIFLAEGIDTPILWGFIKPAIYLPSNIAEDEKEYIIAHEAYHKKRRDYLAKLMAFGITALHWFNPLAWAAYAYFCRDMEISCDEAVLAGAKEDIRKRYASSLLTYAARQNGYVLAPLTFGEPSLQSRIRNVLQYKKKNVIVSVIAILCALVVVTGLVLRPREEVGSGNFPQQDTDAMPVGSSSGNDGNGNSESSENNGNNGNNGNSGSGESNRNNVSNGNPAGGGEPSASLPIDFIPIEGSGYEDVAADFSPNAYYALVEINDAPNKVLLVTDMTYWDGESGREESFSAQVYYTQDGEMYHFGLISGSGTAYPVRYDRDGIYVAGGHFAGRYVLDWERAAGVYFKLESYANETFDSLGNVTYTVMENIFGDRIVEDSSYLDEMNEKYAAAQVVSFYPVAGKLTADVSIDPADTFTALPMGSVAEVDLDGDGVKELVQVRTPETGSVDVDDWVSFGAMRQMLPVIQINNQVFGAAYIRDLNIYDDNLDTSTYYIFDVDKNDSYREIGIYFDGPSGDPATYLFHYGNGQLANLGSFQVRPVQEDYESLRWKPEPVETRQGAAGAYPEGFAYVNQEENRLITLSGDGTIKGSGRLDLVETNWGERTWKLEGDSVGGEKLAEEIQEMYEIEQWDRGDMTATAAQELKMYKDMSEAGETVTVPAGEKVSFYRYYPVEGWLQMAYGDVGALMGEETRKAAESSGAVKYAYFRYYQDGWRMITTAEGEMNPVDAFGNLSFVD